MSNKVDMFLLESGGTNFTETAPRPPVPGEENEKESNGGMSTKSSGSHKSQVSQTSGRSIGSSKGDVNPATPRKSNIDKLVSSNISGAGEDMDAPLGFEPEGSVANSPPFTENSTPPYLKWAESLHNLLEDRDGVQLFRTFLEQEEIGTASVDFWFACLGLKVKERKEDEMQQMIKIIHKKYIKSDKLPFVEQLVKSMIAENITKGLDVMVFNEAQSQVEAYMKNDTYPLFLKSDLYIHYVSKEGDSPKSSNSSSGSNSASRPVSSGPLPPLKEDQVLATDDFAVPYSVIGPPPSKHQNRSYSSLDTKRPEWSSSSYPYHHPRQIPYHVSYAPTSAQDSEIQSLSSQDCLTDDTKSLTDNSSVDGHSFGRERRHRRHRKDLMRGVKPPANKELERFIPRTERAPKDRNIAETDPQKFADMLIERLLRVQKEREKEREKEERMQNSLKAMNRSDISESLERSNMSAVSSKNNTTATSVVPLLTSSYMESEENANSILDDHCSRIWESPSQHTPNRSPGRHSPRSKSPEGFRKGSSSMPGTLHGKPVHSKKQRNDFSHSMSSFDSGMGGDVVQTHKHIHHHHHHHHDKTKRNKQKLELQAQHHSMVVWGDPPTRHSTRQKPSRGNTSSDAQSNLDSGISMVESFGQPQEISLLDPTNTKVLQWIMENEKLNPGVGTSYTDSEKTSSTHKRSSHKSSALNLPTTSYKQSSKKTSSSGGSTGHMNRSASADSGSRVPWIPQGCPVGPGVGPLGVMPSQPIAQDPSMPMMPPPNTRVQLEEVNRRLNDPYGSTQPVKPKSYTSSVPNKDRRQGMSVSGPEFFTPSARGMPSADLDHSMDTGTCRKTKRSSGSGNTSGSSKPEEVSVGYYFCGEPIPYKTTIPLASITLGQLKHYISKRGNFRYFVKTYSNDFDSEAVYEEIREDNKIVPVYDGKILVKIERRDDHDSSRGSDKK